MRTVHDSTAGDPPNGPGQLNWGHYNRPLPNPDGDRFPGVPLLFEVLDLPLFRRHHTADFLGKINSRFLAQAESCSVLCDALNAQLLRQRVEEDITRLINAPADLHRAVDTVLRCDPAFEVAAIERRATVADHPQVLRNAFLQACGGHDDLEHRARGKLRLDGLIQEWMVLIGH